MEKLPGVLLTYRTTKRIPMGETLFSLAYEMEAVIPVDICMPRLRTGEINRDHNAIQLCLSQDKSEERQWQAQIRMSHTNNKSKSLTMRWRSTNSKLVTSSP